MAARVLLTLAIAFFPAILNACMSELFASDLGHDYVYNLTDYETPSVTDDEFDFINTFPESDKKEELKALLVSSHDPNYFISRIGYHKDPDALVVTGFLLRETCTGVNAYMRRLENSNVFGGISLRIGKEINIDGVSRRERIITLYLK